MADTPETGRLVITPEAAALLGATPEEVAAMTLSEFSDRCFDRGLQIITSGWESRGRGGLTVTALKWEMEGADNAG